MAKVPDYVKLALVDSKGELRRFSALMDQLHLQQKDRHSTESQVFYSLYTICVQVHAAVEGVVDTLERAK